MFHTGFASISLTILLLPNTVQYLYGTTLFWAIALGQLNRFGWHYKERSWWVE